MVCKYFLPSCQLLFHFISRFLSCAEALEFGMAPLVQFCFCGLCFWCPIQEIIVKKLFLCVFSQDSYLLTGLPWWLRQ